jgi:uncharacterized membrane protein
MTPKGKNWRFPGALPILWTPGTGMQSLGRLPTFFSASDAIGINDRGEVVGESFDMAIGSNQVLGKQFVWKPGIGLQPLLGDGSYGGVNGINNLGEVVGQTEQVSGNLIGTAFIWESGSGIQSLGALSSGMSSM